MKPSLLLSFLIIFLISGCNPEETPSAPEFTLQDEYFTVGEAIRFAHVSQETNYQWDFGNGQTSNLREPSISYDEPGIYTISLTIGPSAQERVVQQDVRIGQFMIYEVQLLNFLENHWLQGGNITDPRQGSADVFYRIVEYDHDNEEEKYKIHYQSEVTPNVEQNDLPLTWETESFPLTKIIHFYDHKDGRIIATNEFATSDEWVFNKEDKEGSILYSRGGTIYPEPGSEGIPMFSRVQVKFRVEFPA
ncbi:PKD domain-containing protein [Litoribacter populi]|uniref:PKD domain-containing protein n=1 Tax=Litoribacter populi TaxID=2598460 RepID=UPI0011815745|nr:PKD domain-containing protein [Litoribacter populi]